VVLAFLFGYALTMRPLLRAGVPPMEAGPGEPRFSASLALALVVSGAVAFPAARFLIARGRGHAVVLEHHAHGSRARAAPRRAGTVANAGERERLNDD
jgi:hypothetical protein